MPFVAQSEESRCSPHEVGDDAELECVECGEPMHVVSRYPRQGTLVVRHFRHNQSPEDCSGGESDLHHRVKGIALDHAIAEFGESELAQYGIEVQIGDHFADAALRFQEPIIPLGFGIAIEVQYRNLQKDIRTVEQHYLDRGYSVMWVDAEADYYPAENHRVNLPDPIAVWPNALSQDWDEVNEPLENWLIGPPSDTTDFRTLATEVFEVKFPRHPLTVHLPAEHYEDAEQHLYRSTHWGDLFTGGTYEDAMDEFDLTKKTIPEGEVAFVEWLPDSDDFVAELRQSYESGREAMRYGTPEERTALAEKVTRIVEYNTGGKQPDSVQERTIRLIASHSGLEPDATKAGIATAQLQDWIEKRENGRYSIADE